MPYRKNTQSRRGRGLDVVGGRASDAPAGRDCRATGPGDFVAAREGAPASSSESAKPCVLLAEDDELVRRFATSALRSLHCEVIPCADGIEAVEAFARLQDRIDLVLLDVLMPRLGGAGAFRAIKAIDPDARILLASGFSHPDVVDGLLAAGAAGFLAKPFSLDQLTAAVRRHAKGGPAASVRS